MSARGRRLVGRTRGFSWLTLLLLLFCVSSVDENGVCFVLWFREIM